MVLHPAHRDCEQARNPGLGETDKRNHKCEVWRLGALGDVAPNSSRLRASSQARYECGALPAGRKYKGGKRETRSDLRVAVP